MKIAAYVKVSTKTEEQQSSFVMQRRVYKDLIKSNSDWKSVRVFCDYGRSGLVRNRKEFNKMIKHVLNGKIDLILVKSVSRFSRNTWNRKTCSIHNVASKRVIEKNNMVLERNIRGYTKLKGGYHDWYIFYS